MDKKIHGGNHVNWYVERIESFDVLTKPISDFSIGALIIATNRHFGSPISCATTEMPLGVSQQWIDAYCWFSDKKAAPVQVLGSEHAGKYT